MKQKNDIKNMSSDELTSELVRIQSELNRRARVGRFDIHIDIESIKDEFVSKSDNMLSKEDAERMIEKISGISFDKFCIVQSELVKNTVEDWRSEHYIIEMTAIKIAGIMSFLALFHNRIKVIDDED